MSLLSTNKLANDVLFKEDILALQIPKYNDTTANFTGTLQNGGSNVLVDTDIDSTVQGYSATSADYSDTTANFTGTLQNGGSNVVVDSDIGVTIQGYDLALKNIGNLTYSADKLIYSTGVDTFSTATVTSFARTLLDDTTQSAMRTTLGLIPGSTIQSYDADIPTVKATTEEMELGLETQVRSMSPYNIKQAINASGITVSTAFLMAYGGL